MNLEQSINLAKAYNDLGWAVQQQLDKLVAGATTDDGEDLLEGLNPNALRLIQREFVFLLKNYGVEDADLLENTLDELLGEMV